MKKIMHILIVICVLCLPQSVFATEAGAYESNGRTAFFGEYEYPSEEPEIPPQVLTPGGGGEQGNNQRLPQTGSDGGEAYLITGLAALLVAGIMLIKRRKKNEEKSIID